MIQEFVCFVRRHGFQVGTAIRGNFLLQHSGGTRSHFVRDVKHNKAFLEDFFARTGKDYQRFNYLGEWHSHPLFAPTPSAEDLRTMWDIVRDPQVGANFVILLIVRLERSNLEMSATLFVQNYPQAMLTVELEPAPPSSGWWATIKKLFLS